MLHSSCNFSHVISQYFWFILLFRSKGLMGLEGCKQGETGWGRRGLSRVFVRRLSSLLWGMGLSEKKSFYRLRWHCRAFVSLARAPGEELSASAAVTLAESRGLWGGPAQLVWGALIWMTPGRPDFLLHPMLRFPLWLLFDLHVIRISKNTRSLVTLPDT